LSENRRFYLSAVFSFLGLGSLASFFSLTGFAAFGSLFCFGAFVSFTSVVSFEGFASLTSLTSFTAAASFTSRTALTSFTSFTSFTSTASFTSGHLFLLGGFLSFISQLRYLFSLWFVSFTIYAVNTKIIYLLDFITFSHNDFLFKFLLFESKVNNILYLNY
jgi:hypothetical protein